MKPSWTFEEKKSKKQKKHFCLLFISVCAKVPKVKRAWEIHKGQTAHAKQWNTIFIYFSFFDMHSIKSTTVIIVSFLSCSVLSLLFMSIYPTACCMIIISGKQKTDYMANTFWRASYCFNYPSVNSALRYTVYTKRTACCTRTQVSYNTLVSAQACQHLGFFTCKYAHA